MADSTVFVELRAIITDFQAKMAEARGEMSSTSEAGASKFGALSSIGGGLLAGVGVAAAGVGVLAVKMGNDLEDARAKLETALTGAGETYAQFAKPIAAADTAMENLGYTNAQTQDALSTGIVATGNATKAISLLSTAANLAAYKHIGLSDAMTVVAKASEGQLRPLKQLGIDLPVASGGAERLKKANEALQSSQLSLSQVEEKVHDGRLKGKAAVDALATAHLGLAHAQQNYNDVANASGTILDVLNKRLGGQAAAAAGTFSGKMEVAKARTEDLLAQLGLKLIPILEKVVATVLNVVVWFEKHRAVAEALGIAVGSVLVVAIGAYIVSMVAAAAATLAAAAPILAIIAAVALLGVGIYELVTHWAQVWGFIKQIADDVWKWLKGAFADVVGFITSHWQVMAQILLTVVTLGIGAIPALIWHYWSQIKDGIADVVNFITSHWQLLVQILLTVVTGGIGAIPALIWHYWGQITSFTKQLWNDVSGFFTHLWSDVTGGVQDAVNKIITTWNNVIWFYGSFGSTMASVGAHMWDWILDGFKAVEHGIADAWNHTVGSLDFSVPSWVPGIGGDGFAAPKIPYLAAGTDFFAGGMAIVGERGPELVNLPRGSQVIPNNRLGAGGAPTGDLVIQLGESEFVRVAGPMLRSWFAQNPNRNSVHGHITP